MRDMVRKFILFFTQQVRFHPVRRLRAWYYFKNGNIRMGKGISLRGFTDKVITGQDNDYYDGCMFLITPDAEFRTGDHVTLSYHVLIACHERIIIGNDVMVGEFTSIRDTTHDYRTGGTMRGSPDRSDPVTIGNNVWIGRGCLISGGTIIEDGVVVAANSVVKGRLEENSVYGGSPAVFIKKRI